MPTFLVPIDLSTIARQLTSNLTGRYHSDKHQIDAIKSFIQEITECVPNPDDTEFVKRMAEYFTEKLEWDNGLGE